MKLLFFFVYKNINQGVKIHKYFRFKRLLKKTLNKNWFLRDNIGNKFEIQVITKKISDKGLSVISFLIRVYFMRSIRV